MHDVVIIGGGPGGLYAARELSASGFDVVVLEEHSQIGSPVHCTGILGADAYTEFDLPRNAVLNQLRTARFYSPLGQTFEYTPDRIEAVVVDRKVFDETLKLQAVAAGATIAPGSRAVSIAMDSDAATVGLADRSVKARACILACGANYVLQRMLGLGTPSVFLHSAQAELPVQCDAEEVEIHFGSAIAPKGFAWVVPVRRGESHYVRVGLMSDGNPAALFRDFVEAVSDRWGIRDVPLTAPRRKVLPLAPISRTFGDRLLVIGDAADLVKPTTGGGIYYSIVSAGLAAQVLAECLRSDDLDCNALAKYENHWRKRLDPELKIQLAFRKYGQRLTDNDMEQLFDLVRTDGVIPLLRKAADFNQQRGLILSLFRHKQFREIFLRTLT